MMIDTERRYRLPVARAFFVGFLAAILQIAVVAPAFGESGSVETSTVHKEAGGKVRGEFLGEAPAPVFPRPESKFPEYTFIVPVDPGYDPSAKRPTRPAVDAPRELLEAATSRAPGDLVFFRLQDLGTGGTNGQNSTSNEPSLAAAGNVVFWTGNWFASVSGDGGQTFSYVNPFVTFPSVNNGFCCDQISIYERTRGMVIWLLQYNQDANTNTHRIAISTNQDDVLNNNWIYWDFSPSDFGFAATGFWSDFPELALSDNFLWMTTNVFTNPGNAYSGTVFARFPLDDLFDGGAVSGMAATFTSNAGSLRLTHGATDEMFGGAHVDNNTVRVYRWHESSSTVSWSDVDHDGYTTVSSTFRMLAPRVGVASTATGGTATTLTTNANWLANQWVGQTVTLRPGLATQEQFQIVTNAANTLTINGTWVVQPQNLDGFRIETYWMTFWDNRITAAWTSNGEIGLMWTAAQGGDFPFPYIEVLLISDTTLTLLDQGQIWTAANAFTYPSAHPNSRGDVGGTFAWGGTVYPSAAVWLSDSFSPNGGNDPTSPTLYSFQTGTNGPVQQFVTSSNIWGGRWGDYLTTRAQIQYDETWVGSGFAMTGPAPLLPGVVTPNATPRFVWFGRQQDTPPATNTIYVDGSHSGAQRGTLTNPYLTVNAGAFASRDGDTLIVQAGNYPESNVVISSDVVLEAQGGSVIIGE